MRDEDSTLPIIFQHLQILGTKIDGNEKSLRLEMQAIRKDLGDRIHRLDRRFDTKSSNTHKRLDDIELKFLPKRAPH